MNILFVGLTMICSIKHRSLYTDVLREFAKNGDKLTIITAKEKRFQEQESGRFIQDKNGDIEYILVPTGNVTHSKNYVAKGIATIQLGARYKKAFRKGNVKKKFDLVICVTPSITFEPFIRYVINRDKAKVVLLLKDMWPYDLAFDGILTKRGVKGIVYRYFEEYAKKLYNEASVIGCMSQRNVDFLITATKNESLRNKLVIIPNSIDPLPTNYISDNRFNIRDMYGLPHDKTIFLYGGNLGVAQGISFLIHAIREASKIGNAFFLIVGEGTEATLIEETFRDSRNIKYMRSIAHNTYEQLAYACDVGLVFLTWTCHTPNYPSRILPYMQACLPVICCTDDTTDVGINARDNGYGLSCKSNDIAEFCECVKCYLDENKRKKDGERSRKCVEKNFSSEETYRLICESIIQANHS